MLRDARSLHSGDHLETDVCIVGAGAAGITLALELIDRPLRVAVLEGGGLHRDEASQELYRGTTTGRAYYELDDCRLRCLGGSTNFWGGWCRPLDAADFEERDWIPHSGWPFPKSTLDPYYARAQAVCGLGAYDYEPGRWRNGDCSTLVPPSSPALEDTVIQVGPVRFGEAYRTALERARNVLVLLHANAVELDAAPSRRSIARVRAATIQGNRFDVRARCFILAAGGIENPRLLLASRRSWSCGLGNEHGLVGRFFTEHLHVAASELRPTGGSLGFYGFRQKGSTTVRGAVGLTPRVRCEQRLLGCALTLHNADDPHDVLRPAALLGGYESLGLLARALRRRERPSQVWRHLGRAAWGLNESAGLIYRRFVKPPLRRAILACRAEQVPNPENRVTLDDQTDLFGMPRARLHWQLSGEDAESFRRARRIWTREIAGATCSVSTFPDDESRPECMVAGAHHMGTTRMHRDPRQGVVDPDGRVHGFGNLFIAGSSAFPTGGWVPPTLTIVALALRLADHVKTRMGD